MKIPNRNIFISLCVAGLLGSTAAMADTATVSVSATITGTCRFNSGGTISFALDQASTSPAAGTVTQPEFWCTKGTNYTISDDLGLYEDGTTYRMKKTDSADYIPYSFTYTDTGTGTGKTAAIALDIAAEVANAAFIDVPAGTYQDTVTLTINP